LQELGLGGRPERNHQNGNLMGPMPEKQRQRLIEMWTLIKAGGYRAQQNVNLCGPGTTLACTDVGGRA
jgi:hypothetical protein